MDFFGAQEAAKRRTFWAVVLFALGVVVTALAVYAAFMMALHYQSENWYRAPIDFFDWQTFLWCVLGTAAVVLGGTVYKICSLGGGGRSVAESVGARPIDPNTTDEKERVLLNVVEEMSIASGYGVPQVGVLDDEPEINAFAAALSPQDAVVVVTRGTLDQLTRDELQAVIGHEFSHLSHGDSRLNINLAGWIWGLFIVSIVGRLVLNMSGGQGSSDRRRNGAAFMIFGFALLIIGAIGFFFGRVIQAIISRERESRRRLLGPIHPQPPGHGHGFGQDPFRIANRAPPRRRPCPLFLRAIGTFGGVLQYDGHSSAAGKTHAGHRREL